jgi:hypothetical protein
MKKNLNKIFLLQFIGILIFIIHILYYSTELMQKYGAILITIGIIGEVYIMDGLSIISYDKKENDYITDEFIKTNYYNIVHKVNYAYMICGTIIASYWDCIIHIYYTIF